ncbi:hypothetical protein ACTXT7_012348 [Hymenolepis weldensis]
MEVVHACLRLVRSAPMTTAIQIASRLLILWGVLYMYSAVKVHVNFNKMMFVSWCLADITRYLYYLVNIFIKPPRLLTILRYNLFLILYPTGITGEIALMWYSLPYAAKDPWLQYPLPNVFNFGFNTYQLYFLLLTLYAPCSPLMYAHMLAQREKVMGKKKCLFALDEELTGRKSVIKHTYDAKSIVLRLRRTPVQYQDFVREEIIGMLENKIIRPSFSAWPAPVSIEGSRSQVKSKKCKFLQTAATYPGHIISWVHTDPEKTEKIRNWLTPRNAEECSRTRIERRHGGCPVPNTRWRGTPLDMRQ